MLTRKIIFSPEMWRNIFLSYEMKVTSTNFWNKCNVMKIILHEKWKSQQVERFIWVTVKRAFSKPTLFDCRELTTYNEGHFHHKRLAKFLVKWIKSKWKRAQRSKKYSHRLQVLGTLQFYFLLVSFIKFLWMKKNHPK